MLKDLQIKRWNLYCSRKRQLLVYGLKNGSITLYDEELIAKLRHIYYGGIPASILLLCDALSNGRCYDQALLMSRAFLNTEDDIKLIYATIDGIKLNPQYIGADPGYADHCFLQRTTKDGQTLIYDTSSGFVYDKDLYWELEHPQVRKTNNKEEIITYLNQSKQLSSKESEIDPYSSLLILPIIEKTYQNRNKIYSQLLQREIETYKDKINYDTIVKEAKEIMKKIHKKSQTQ